MITESDFDALVKNDRNPAASMFMALDPPSEDRQANAIRLKNQLRAVSEAMEANGMDPTTLRERVGARDDPPQPLWSYGAQGFALFATSEEVHWFDLPVAVDEQVVVGPGYHVTPLLSALTGCNVYFLLCLDQENADLYRCSRYALEPFRDSVMEESLEKIRGLRELEGNVGFHSSSRSKGRHADSQYHALGDNQADYSQTEIDEFAQGVAKAVDQALQGRATPLVVAADPNLLGMYRRHATYRGLLGDAIAKSPSGLSTEALHEASLPIAEGAIDRSRIAAVSDVTAALNRGDGTAASDPDKMVELAERGQIAMLLLADPHAPALPGAGGAEDRHERDSSPDSADARLQCDRIVKAAHTFGARLYAVPRESMPGRCRVAALLRY